MAQPQMGCTGQSWFNQGYIRCALEHESESTAGTCRATPSLIHTSFSQQVFVRGCTSRVHARLDAPHHQPCTQICTSYTNQLTDRPQHTLAFLRTVCVCPGGLVVYGMQQTSSGPSKYAPACHAACQSPVRMDVCRMVSSVNSPVALPVLCFSRPYYS